MLAKPRKFGLLWEQNDESGNEISACIRGDAPAFAAAAAILLSYVQSMPDSETIKELFRDYERRTPVDTTGVMALAVQLGGIKDDCATDADLCTVYPEAPTLESLAADYFACYGERLLSAIQYRNKPDDECMVQVSTDNGSTWSDAWRMDNCGNDVINTYFYNSNLYQGDYVTYAQTYVNNYNENYTDSIGDIYPGLMPDEEEQDFIDNALCHALVRLVDTVCNLSIDYYNSRDEQQDSVNLGLAITAAVLAVIGVAGSVATLGSSLSLLAVSAGIWGAAMGVGAAVGNALYDRWQENSKEVYEDESAKDTVVCYLNDQFIGQDVTQALFASALDSFPGSGNALAIAQTVKESIAIDQTYAAFAGFASRSLEYAQTNEIFYDDCPCDNSYTWEEITDVPNDINVDKWTLNPDYGVLVPGSYWDSTTKDTGAIFYRALVLTRTVDVDTILTYAKVEGTFTGSTIEDTNDFTFYLQWGSFTTGIQEPEYPTMPVELPGLNEAGGSVFLQLLPTAQTGDTEPGGIARITKITLRGLNTPPA